MTIQPSRFATKFGAFLLLTPLLGPLSLILVGITDTFPRDAPFSTQGYGLLIWAIFWFYGGWILHVLAGIGALISLRGNYRTIYSIICFASPLMLLLGVASSYLPGFDIYHISYLFYGLYILLSAAIPFLCLHAIYLGHKLHHNSPAVAVISSSQIPTPPHTPQSPNSQVTNTARQSNISVQPPPPHEGTPPQNAQR